MCKSACIENNERALYILIGRHDPHHKVSLKWSYWGIPEFECDKKRGSFLFLYVEGIVGLMVSVCGCWCTSTLALGGHGRWGVVTRHWRQAALLLHYRIWNTENKITIPIPLQLYKLIHFTTSVTPFNSICFRDGER